MWRSALVALAVLSLGAPAIAADVVRVGLTLSAAEMPLLMARERGYFRDQGIELQTVVFDSAVRQVAPLATGELDVGGGAANAALYNAAARQIDIRIVANRSAMAPGYRFQSIVVRKDLVDSGHFKDYPDLKGMRIALPAPGIGSQAVIEAMAQRGGMQYGDIQQVFLNFGGIVAGMASRAIDGALMVEPYASMVGAAQTGVVFAPTSDVFPDEEVSFVLFGDRFARERPELGKRYLKALLRGVRDYNDAITNGRFNDTKKAADAVEIFSRELKIDADQVRRSEQHFAHPDGEINLDSMRRVLAFFKAQGLVTDPKVQVETLVDMSFVRAAAKELGPYIRAR